MKRPPPPTAARRARLLAVVLSVLGVGAGAPGCGARTGLTIPDYDAGPDAPTFDAPDAPPVCVPGEFPLVPTSADVVFTIDRSGSMRLTIDGVEDAPPALWRWALLRNALAGAFATLDPRVNVGGKFYPNPLTPRPGGIGPEEACATAAGIDVPVSPTGAARVLGIFDSTDPLGGTPTAQALAEATAALRRSGSPRRFVVLATDGGPNCNDDPALDPDTCVCTSRPDDCRAPDGVYSCLDDVRTIGVIDATFRIAGIPVFVVGIEDPSRPDLADAMDRMAIAGGRPREGTPRRFYSVRTAAELEEALAVITSSISACGFVSPSVPTDERTFSLHLEADGGREEIPRGSADGWAWTDRAAGELELRGVWCERAQRPGVTIIAEIDTCP